MEQHTVPGWRAGWAAIGEVSQPLALQTGLQGDLWDLSGQQEQQDPDSYLEMAIPLSGMSNVGEEPPLSVSSLIQVLFSIRARC